MNIFRRLANAWWKWRHRCKKVRYAPEEMLSVLSARTYAWCLANTLDPCKVCGERTCRWATYRVRPAAPATGGAK